MGSFKYQKNPTIPEIGICLDLLNHMVIRKDGKVSIQYTLQLLKELIEDGELNLSHHPFKSSPFRRAKETAIY